MLLNIAGKIAFPVLMGTINHLPTEQLPQAFCEVQALISDDDFAKAQGVQVQSYMLLGIRKEMASKLANLSSEEKSKLEKWAVDSLSADFALSTSLSLEDFKGQTLGCNGQWAMFLNTQTKGAYFYNVDTQAIVNYFEGNVIGYKIESAASFWVEIARLIFEQGSLTKI